LWPSNSNDLVTMAGHNTRAGGEFPVVVGRLG
jgi:hypothetical protein